MSEIARLFPSVVPRARRARTSEIEETGPMPDPEHGKADAGSQSVGDDLGSIAIEHYAIHDRPDLIPEGVDYISNYRLRTPGRVLFFSASHKISRRADGGIELEIIFAPVKSGELRYAGQTSSQFSPPELARVREIIADYLRTDPKALHPIMAPKDQVKSIRVRG